MACKSCRYRHCSEKGGGPQTLLGAPATFLGSCRCSFLGSYLLQLLFQSTCMTEGSSKAQQQQAGTASVVGPNLPMYVSYIAVKRVSFSIYIYMLPRTSHIASHSCDDAA